MREKKKNVIMNSVILGNLEEYGVLKNAIERNNVILILMRLSWMRKSGVYSVCVSTNFILMVCLFSYTTLVAIKNLM